MANTYEKHYTCTTRKEVLQRVYDHLVAYPTNWTVIHEEGGYSSSTPADQDYFVIECNTPWGDADVHQQLLLCARDAASSTATFGGSAGTKWTISDDSFSFVYSPDGGWSSTSKDFADRVGSLAEKQVDWDNSTSATPGFDVSIVTTPTEFLLFGLEASTTAIGLFAGTITSVDSSVVDARPCAIYWGIVSLGAANYTWSATTLPAGYVPNDSRSGWLTATTEASGTRIDTYGASKNGGAYVELPLPVYSVSVAKYAGTFQSLRRVSTALANGDVSSAGDRVAYAGVTFPWEV